MKKNLILFLFLLSCEKEISPETESEPLFILKEQITYDPNGVIFKIINDIDSLEIGFGRFEYFSVDSFSNKYFVWLKPYEYACWRYPLEMDKQIRIIYKYDQRIFWNYNGTIFFCEECRKPAWFQEMFYGPINDTVIVKISKIFKWGIITPHY